MSAAAKIYPAYRLWTDDYFKSISELGDEYVVVEGAKIENRTKPYKNVSFHEFLQIYNNSNSYLVSTLPDPLKQDVYLPLPLQCPDLFENLLVENVMWMSSGNTFSVVHSDDLENIICLIRGHKEFVLVDPHKYAQQVPLEHEDQSYSDINVTQVDYTKYPGLLNVLYHKVQLKAGDCLYVPYKWIHQVVSKESNVAVNVWWRNQQPPIHITSCSQHHNNTLADVIFHRGDDDDDDDAFKEELTTSIRKSKSPINYQVFAYIFLEENEVLNDLPYQGKNYLKKMFMLCDSDHDNTVTLDDLQKLSPKVWRELQVTYQLFVEEMNKQPIRDEL